MGEEAVVQGSDNGGLDHGGDSEGGGERAVPRDTQVVEYSGHGRSAMGSEGERPVGEDFKVIPLVMWGTEGK